MFIVDVYSPMLVGWPASRPLRSDLAIEAPEMAVCNRGRTGGVEGLIHHSDSGAQLRFKGPSRHYRAGREWVIVKGFNGLSKSVLIYPKGLWSGLADVEFATLTYVVWFNNRRLHGKITAEPGYTTRQATKPATTIEKSQPNR